MPLYKTFTAECKNQANKADLAKSVVKITTRKGLVRIDHNFASLASETMGMQDKEDNKQKLVYKGQANLEGLEGKYKIK